jgi:hypothetical protein
MSMDRLPVLHPGLQWISDEQQPTSMDELPALHSGLLGLILVETTAATLSALPTRSRRPASMECFFLSAAAHAMAATGQNGGSNLSPSAVSMHHHSSSVVLLQCSSDHSSLSRKERITSPYFCGNSEEILHTTSRFKATRKPLHATDQIIPTIFGMQPDKEITLMIVQDKFKK